MATGSKNKERRPAPKKRRRRARLAQRPGAPPGTLVAPEERRIESVRLRVFDYDLKTFEELDADNVEEALAYLDRPTKTWIDVVGLHDLSILEAIGQRCGLHKLALEDVLDTEQRPKIDVAENYVFIVLRLLWWKDLLDAEQISIFFGDSWVLTFQESHGDVFDPVRARLRASGPNAGRIRGAGPDYLAYALVDSLVDQFFPLLEGLGERLEELEDELVFDPRPDRLGMIHGLKKNLLTLRRAAWPQREVVSAFERHQSPLIAPETKVFLRDAYDHAVQILDMVESYRDLASGLMDLYLSSLSNRMNEVMKVLTIMASIFIPLTFLAGVYGMNFDQSAGPFAMPELSWAWSYPVFWVVNIGLVIGMLWFFRRKRWL